MITPRRRRHGENNRKQKEHEVGTQVLEQCSDWNSFDCHRPPWTGPKDIYGHITQLLPSLNI
jgi:hypothetical protein